MEQEPSNHNLEPNPDLREQLRQAEMMDGTNLLPEMLLGVYSGYVQKPVTR
jgi:hypothetical protein